MDGIGLQQNIVQIMRGLLVLGWLKVMGVRIISIMCVVCCRLKIMVMEQPMFVMANMFICVLVKDI